MRKITFFCNRVLSTAVVLGGFMTSFGQTPTIETISANHGCANTDTVIITGTNFANVTAVSIGDSAVASYTVDDVTQITAVVGNAVTGTFSVTTDNGAATDTTLFTVNALPEIFPFEIDLYDNMLCSGYYISVLDTTRVPVGATFSKIWTIHDGSSTATPVNIYSNRNISYCDIILGNNAGSFTLHYNLSVNGCSASKDTLITIIQGPAPPLVVGDTVCLGASIVELTATSSDTVKWYRASYIDESTLIGIGETINPVGLAGSNLMNTDVAGTYTFYATTVSSNGCTNFNVVPVRLVVEDYSVLPVVSGNVVCEGSPVILSVLPNTGNIDWFDGDGNNIAHNTTSINVGILQEDSTFSVQLTSLSGCGNSTKSVNVIVNHATSYTNHISLCSGSSYNIGSHTYNSAGTYLDTLVNARGCDSVVTTIVTIRQLSSKTQNFSLCPGESVTVGSHTYTASGTYHDVLVNAAGCDSNVTTIISATTITRTLGVNGFTATALETNATYQWKNCATGELVEGETERVFTATSGGVYQVLLTRNDCVDSSICVLLDTAQASGIVDVDGNDVAVFPNPFTDKLTLSPSVPYILYDVVGRPVYNSEDHKDTLGALPVGTYILKTAFGNTRVVKI